MKLILVGLAILAAVYAEVPSGDYLPPTEEIGASQLVESNFLESEPAHSLADDGYRYRTVKRLRLRHRREVGETSGEYLPPHVESAAVQSYAAPVEAAQEVSVAAVPVEQSYDVAAAAEPAHTLSSDGYRYKTVKRYRLRRRRREVGEAAGEYLPPQVESAAVQSYAAPVDAAQEVSVAAVPVEQSYDVAAVEPAHTLSSDGYRYRTVKRYRLRRRRREVGEVSGEYLPPNAGSLGVESYAEPVATAQEVAYASEPVAQSYDLAASEPAHTLSSDGYRYKTVKRLRYRHRH